MIEKVVQSLDWDSILLIHKAFKHGVGQGSEVIPGLKRKVYEDSLGVRDLKSELKSILKYVVENDYRSYIYGNWIISWYNQQWNEQTVIETYTQNDQEIELEIELPNSKLEVVYAPQRICIMSDLEENESSVRISSDHLTLKTMLDKALAEENYEMAQKIQDLLNLTCKSEKF